LEWSLTDQAEQIQPYPLESWDWAAMIAQIWDDLQSARAVESMAAAFHNGLIKAMLDQARGVGCQQVMMTGGCFQNRYLQERAYRLLKADGLTPILHRHLPPNDGNLGLGQLWVGLHQIKEE